MKYILEFLLGTLFLFSMICSVSAGGYDWTMFGNNYQPTSQAQQSSGISRFNLTGVTTENISSGQSQFNFPTQTLIGSLSSGSNNYLVYSNGNYIKVYTNGLTFLSDNYLTYSPMKQMSMVDWDNDGGQEIAGFFYENSTRVHFQVFKLNSSSGFLYEIYNQDFDDFIFGTTGVRCSGSSCYGLIWEQGYRWYDFNINQSGYLIHMLYSYNNTYFPLEPPSKVDYNNDGIIDFLAFSEQKVFVYNQLGAIIREWNYSRGADRDELIRGAKFFYPIGSVYWKVAVIYDVPYDSWSSLECSPDIACAKFQILNINDGTIGTELSTIATGNSGDNPRTMGLAIGDYNGDFFDDIWIVGSKLGTNRYANLNIYKSDGSVLYNSNSLGANIGAIYPNSQITLAKMDNDDNVYDVILYDGQMRIWSPTKSAYIYNDTTFGGATGSCIPADLTFDGLTDIICSKNVSTRVYFSTYLNQNPTINSVLFDPSILVQVGTNVNAIISATDPEGNSPIYYTHSCFTGDNWSVATTSSTRTCGITSVGVFNFTIGVRDPYHSDYVYYSQDITATTTGYICDNDNICEVSQGETSSNCPNDCGIGGNGTQSSTETGGMTLPTEIVNVNNVNQGLLPEIYFGTLGFLSNTLQPIMIIIFVIFFVLIMLALGMIIKKVAHKVGELAH